MDKQPDVFAAIGDPTRRQILMLLTAGALSINTLAENFNISRPAVSKHIKLLQQTGLIAINDIGRERFCTLDATGFNEIRDWLEFYEQFWNNKLTKLGQILDENFSTSSQKNKPKK
jgi:DNA-binding transcriptional ArsR family regulator